MQSAFGARRFHRERRRSLSPEGGRAGLAPLKLVVRRVPSTITREEIEESLDPWQDSFVHFSLDRNDYPFGQSSAYRYRKDSKRMIRFYLWFEDRTKCEKFMYEWPMQDEKFVRCVVEAAPMQGMRRDNPIEESEEAAFSDEDYEQLMELVKRDVGQSESERSGEEDASTAETHSTTALAGFLAEMDLADRKKRDRRRRIRDSDANGMSGFNKNKDWNGRGGRAAAASGKRSSDVSGMTKMSDTGTKQTMMDYSQNSSSKVSFLKSKRERRRERKREARKELRRERRRQKRREMRRRERERSPDCSPQSANHDDDRDRDRPPPPRRRGLKAKPERSKGSSHSGLSSDWRKRKDDWNKDINDEEVSSSAVKSDRKARFKSGKFDEKRKRYGGRRSRKKGKSAEMRREDELSDRPPKKKKPRRRKESKKGAGKSKMVFKPVE